MSSILLKGGLVLTFKNNNPLPHAFKADILVKGDTIVEVAPDLTVPEGSCEIVDCTGKWVTPGQIDTHRYDSQCPNTTPTIQLMQRPLGMYG